VRGVDKGVSRVPDDGAGCSCEDGESSTSSITATADLALGTDAFDSWQEDESSGYTTSQSQHYSVVIRYGYRRSGHDWVMSCSEALSHVIGEWTG
jgi:hypothetical protein